MKSMKRCVFALLFSFMVIAVQAQIQVKGKVQDEYGESLPSLHILEKGTSHGTTTDIDGNFTISVKNSKSVLVFSYLGYKTQDVTVGNKTTINVSMEPDVHMLGEVEIISDGYTDVKARDFTGAAAKANLEDMLKSPITSFDEALAGRVAGVRVSSGDGSPGGSFNITIRGNNSLTQSNSPLYVIDGFPMEVDGSNASSSINPADIESINILKDASATAIYGSRGANGVVVITTKKGQVGKSKINYSGSFTVHQLPEELEMMNVYEFIQLQQEIRTRDEMNKTYFREGKTLEDYRGMRGVNWQDEIFRTSFSHKHYVNMSGGKEGTRYSASLSYDNQEGIILNSDYERYQGRLSLEQKMTDKLKVSINANYTRAITQGVNPAASTSSVSNNLMWSVWGSRPVAWEPGLDLLTAAVDPAFADNANDYRFNPVLSTKEEHRKGTNDNLAANISIDYEILKGLKLRVSGGYRLDKGVSEAFNNSNTRWGHPNRGVEGVNGSIGHTESTKLLNDNILTYDRRIKKNSLNFLAGVTMQKDWRSAYSTSMFMVPNESLGMSGLDEGLFKGFSSLKTESALLSYLGQFSYNYASKYYAKLTFRADGSSKFPKNSRWGYFPSTSLSYFFTREDFAQEAMPWFSTGKLRLSWGMTGNNRVADFASLAKLTGGPAGEYPFGGAYSIGYLYTDLENSKLKWETTEQWNLGLDLGFLKDRITATVDLYIKNTKDLLLQAPLPASTGFKSTMMNIGKMRNTGIEFTLNTTNIQTKDFQWDTNFNIAFNKNKIVELATNQESLTVGVTGGSGLAYISQKGQSTGQMYGLIFEGTHKYEDFDIDASGKYVLKPTIPTWTADRSMIRPGDAKFKDINGDGQVNDMDRTIIGRGQPIHTGGFTNNFKYKAFDLNIVFLWSYGNDIINANRMYFESGQPRKDTNMFKAYANRWTPENSTSNIPRVRGQGPDGYSSRIIEDGSYLRLKNVTFSYNLPRKFLMRIGMTSGKVFLSGENLLTFTSYSGYDPEVSTRNSALTPGYDYSAYPRAWSVSAGLNINF